MPARGLSEEMKDLVLQSKKIGCVIVKILSKLEGPDKAALDELLNSKVSAAKIAIVLNKNQFPVGENAIWKHRTGRCCCMRHK
jgi:hypothetical protein